MGAGIGAAGGWGEGSGAAAGGPRCGGEVEAGAGYAADPPLASSKPKMTAVATAPAART